jgi:signal transduction histidine kinase/phage shock protein PspC (stress-responsive transcriptional regulator)
VTSSTLAARRLYRRPDRGYLAGVAEGIGEHLHVRPALVRWIFVALVLSGGMGIALYGVYWIVLPAHPDAPPARMPRWLEYVVAAVATLVAVAAVSWALPFGGLFVPTLRAVVGGALIWRQAGEKARQRWRSLSRSSLAAGTDDRIGRVRLAVGASCVIAGAAIVLWRADFTAVRDGLLAMFVTVVGLALLTGPAWMRMAGQLGTERAERIRSQERADIAAQLHDSVLQTLALIQRNANSPREVTRLARGQERELRNLLYGAREAAGQLEAELAGIAADVEDAYAIAVETVVVGDAPLDDALAAACAAAREALVNAAKHAGVLSVSLYAEVEDHTASVFVKDRGAGFDLAAIPADRQGVRGSIVARVERHGGRVQVRSAPGSGTEVEIVMPFGAKGEKS